METIGSRHTTPLNGDPIPHHRDLDLKIPCKESDQVGAIAIGISMPGIIDPYSGAELDTPITVPGH